MYRTCQLRPRTEKKRLELTAKIGLLNQGLKKWPKLTIKTYRPGSTVNTCQHGPTVKMGRANCEDGTARDNDLSGSTRANNRDRLSWDDNQGEPTSFNAVDRPTQAYSWYRLAWPDNWWLRRVGPCRRLRATEACWLGPKVWTGLPRLTSKTGQLRLTYKKVRPRTMIETGRSESTT